MNLTQSQYAARRGVNRRTVIRWKKAGLLVFDDDGRIIAEESDRRVDGNLYPQKSHPGPRPGDDEESINPDDALSDATEAGDLKEALTRKEWALARLRELELRIKTREYMPVREMESEVAWIATTLRNSLLTLADRIADDLAVIEDPEEIRRLLQAEIEEAMRAFCREELPEDFNDAGAGPDEPAGEDTEERLP